MNVPANSRAIASHASMSSSGAELSGVFRHPYVWRKPAIWLSALGAIALYISRSTWGDDWIWLGTVCLAGLVTTTWAMVKALRDGAKRAITDHFIVLIGAFSLYFLFGPLILVYGPEEQASYLLDWYPTTAKSAVFVTGINLLGLGMLLLSGSVVRGDVIEQSFNKLDAILARIAPIRAFWTFFIVGGTCSLYVFMVDLEGGSEVVSGVLRTLSQMVLISILIGGMYEGRDEGVLRGFALMAALFLSIGGLISFNKSTALYPWLMFLFGSYLRLPSLRRILAAVSVLMLALIVISRPISDARIMLGSSPSAPSIANRWSIMETAFAANDELSPGDFWGGAWVRLCYTVPQVAAVELYDGGFGGDDVELAGWVLLPRILFPQKPIITRTGTDFNDKITGRDSSSTGIGIFVSGYYNLGWWGVVIVSAISGVVLATFSAASRAIVKRRSMLLLPVALLGGYIAFRVDGYFVADFWGTFAMTMVPLLLASMALRPVSRETSA